MTTFLLIRHASTQAVGKMICGRMTGIHLNAEGRRQAALLAQRLSSWNIAAIFAGPLERARETADAIAKSSGAAVEIRAALDEVNYGNWTGQSITELSGDPLWRRFNSYRSGARIPEGETMLEVQTRVVAELESIRARFPEGTVAVVSHGDVLKSAIGYYVGIPIDLLYRIDVAPASLSVMTLDDSGAVLLQLNEVVHALENGMPICSAEDEDQIEAAKERN